jgi:hypothetical protein
MVSIPQAIEPITGYGDFSGQEYFYVDWFLVTRLTVQCLQDHGFPVTLVPPVMGSAFIRCQRVRTKWPSSTSKPVMPD